MAHDVDRRALDGVEPCVLALLIWGYSSGMWRMASENAMDFGVDS